MVAPARLAALDVLRALESGQVTAGEALARARARLTSDRDRALASEIVLGTLRWRAALDELIGQAASRPLARIDPEILHVLRLSAYQLLHLTRVPASAVVDDGVSLAKRKAGRASAGFVNAVLRTLLRRRRRLELPRRPDLGDVRDSSARERALQYLSVTLSHPRWLVERWFDRVGLAAAEQWARFNNGPAPLTLRANRHRISREELAARLAGEGVRTVATRFAPHGLTVVSGRPGSTPLAGQGLFVVQDEASQLITLLLGAQPGQRLLDACAAPGSKTLALVGEIRDQGLIVASDVRPRRIALLAATIREAGTASVRLVRADVRRPLPFLAPFDGALLDAPCSGLGTLRRDPDIKWRRRSSDLVAFSQAQSTMLANVAQTVRPGGRVVYATCSSEPDENEEVVAAFLADDPRFGRVDLARHPEAVPGLPRPVIDEHGYFRTLPHVHGLEAFFGAVLERQR